MQLLINKVRNPLGNVAKRREGRYGEDLLFSEWRSRGDVIRRYSIVYTQVSAVGQGQLSSEALDTSNKEHIGAIVCKLDVSRQNRRRGYIAMLAVVESCRGLGIGQFVAIYISVVLETEVTNLNAIRPYTNLSFVREKRLFRYYLNGVDAFRLNLFLTSPAPTFEDGHICAKAQGIAG
ncbi:unnamed protein product [Toxocara canis]|uniref:N-acetyltransferase domain-containing protein n=1 Tax=Toxocara canis TaxID=6265 RepID=A0A183V4K6_TOXCA|nr:unnamed protein product [Toxocara canis]